MELANSIQRQYTAYTQAHAYMRICRLRIGNTQRIHRLHACLYTSCARASPPFPLNHPHTCMPEQTQQNTEQTRTQNRRAHLRSMLGRTIWAYMSTLELTEPHHLSSPARALMDHLLEL
eukprot:1137833-Pelagomonas_calceolata.AAC.2